MVFEIYQKGTHNLRIRDNEISFAKTSITFGLNMKVDFLKKGYVEVYLDREENKIGFKPTKNQVTGFKVLYIENQDKLTRITAKQICSLIPVGRYEVTQEKDMYVIKVPEIARK